jgi:hypothetical protein
MIDPEHLMHCDSKFIAFKEIKLQRILLIYIYILYKLLNIYTPYLYLPIIRHG